MSDMLRILHIVSSLGIGSGVMAVLMNYHRHIDRSKIQFDYLSFRETDRTFEQEIADLGGRVYHFHRPSFSRSFRQEALDFFVAHAVEYQVVHCHPIFTSALFGPYMKKAGVSHIIQHSHTTRLSSNPLSAARNFVLLIGCRRYATDFAACSSAAKHIFFWLPQEKVHLIYNAISAEEFRFSDSARTSIRSSLAIPDEAMVLGHIGRFSPEKNHAFLIDVFEQIKAFRPETQLLLVGDGPGMDSVRALSEAKGLEKSIIFAGRQLKVADYLSAMDYFILPSTFEGFGNVLLEAQVSGLHCLASTCVPQEVACSEQASFLPLNDGSSRWAERILQDMPSGLDKRDPVELPGKFDIRIAAGELFEYYNSLLK